MNTPNTPFLQQVARHYLEAQGLEDYCFVFPNRRSGQFFTHYLQREFVVSDMSAGVEQPHLMPRVITINDLVAELTGADAASDIEMMFALYEAYCTAMGERAQEFDKFIYWGQLIIGDFNDIDRSLADAHQIYRNLSDQQSLRSNYLTPEVAEKVRKIFGDSLFTAFFDTSADADLWQHNGHQTDGEEKEGKVKQEFVSLWNALAAIYDEYHRVLERRGVASPGMMLRRAAGAVPDALPYTRFAFVGFGVLSAAEVRLFDNFMRLQRADYWWDNAGVQAMLARAPHDPGALLIDGYCKRFNARQVVPVDRHDCAIRVVAVPSNVGQAKVAFDEVRLMHDESAPVGIETAIVLPDEGLLVPLLHSREDEGLMNVTLGYPLRSSGIVSLMHIVARLHHQAGKERGVWTYYREDVNDILSHPLIKTYFTGEAMSLSNRLSLQNRFRVPASEFESFGFKDLFTPAVDSEGEGSVGDQHAGYIDHLLAFCNVLLDRMPEAAPDENGEEEETAPVLPLQRAFLVMYADVLNQLKRALAECGQALGRSTVFYLVDRLTASAIVPFTGEPLQGLQVMGLLETRSLDFKHLVIVSMNERVFPRHRSINSFIPNYIRRANGMSTIEQQEAIVAFNFYRLLNRAEKVSLVYDSSTQALGSSEPSRYIAQLEKIYGVPTDRVVMTTSVETSPAIGIQVPNDGALRTRYTAAPEDGGSYLSASAINKYISCPLLFYMHYVQGLNDDNEVSDFMDYGTFGTIIHDTLVDCYYNADSRSRGGLFTREEIDRFRRTRLEASVVRNIKKTFLHVPEDRLDTDREPLRGEAFMLIDTIKSYVDFVLDYDAELIERDGPFTILECEEPHNVRRLALGDVEFNFTYRPDRIDRLADGTVRIVDYKTGKDTTTLSPSPGLPALFNNTDKDRRKAILQLFLYCYAYLTEHRGECHRVQPVIYKISAMQESGVAVKRGRGAAEQFVFTMDDDVARDFIVQMSLRIKALYDEDFTQAPERAPSCNYCRFADFCRRTPVQRP